MEHEKEIQEIKDRLTSVESFIFLVQFLILIGLYQFASVRITGN